uniref:Uncharacterized protein n=1 Tax=Timema monikensis TaxID=170555 RepID=A0A7R9HPQ8_9NEOP|nr:unnamed protein product [Timema monikensis]
MNVEEAAGPSHSDAYEAFQTAMNWLERQPEGTAIQLILLKRLRDMAAKKLLLPELSKVQNIKYLGSVIEEKGGSRKDLMRRDSRESCSMEKRKESSSSSSASDYLDDILSVASTSRVEQEKLQAKAGPRKAASTNDVNFTGSSLELNRSTVSEPELGKNINKENEEMPTQGMKNKGKVVVKSVPRKIPDETAPRNVLTPKNY